MAQQFISFSVVALFISNKKTDPYGHFEKKMKTVKSAQRGALSEINIDILVSTLT